MRTAARGPGPQPTRPTSAPPATVPPSCCASASSATCPAFGSAREIQRRVNFPAGGPGVIVMAIEGGIVVVFNATPFATTQTIPALAHRRYALHEVQARGGDPVVKGSRSSNGSFTVPATTAVFVELALVDEDAARREPALGERARPCGLAVEQADADREDRVEAAIAEVERPPASATRNSAVPASTYAALRRAAAAIIFGERSTAVRRRASSRSHTSVAATPWPQPISSTRSPGRMSSPSTTARSRSLTRA